MFECVCVEMIRFDVVCVLSYKWEVLDSSKAVNKTPFFSTTNEIKPCARGTVEQKSYYLVASANLNMCYSRP